MNRKTTCSQGRPFVTDVVVHVDPAGAAGELPARMPPLSHSQDGLGQGWLRLKWAKGQFRSKFDEKVKVLRMGLPIVESLSGLQESIFLAYVEPPNSILIQKWKNKFRILLNYPHYPY